MTEICCASPQTLPQNKNMEVGNVKNKNKRGVNWRKEEVATLLGLWDAFSNKQRAKDHTYKNADVAIFLFKQTSVVCMLLGENLIVL